MLPFLRNRDEGSASSEVETQVRDHDEGFDLLDAVAEDIIMALEKKDKKRLKGALESLCQHIQDLDDEQDQTTMGEAQ